MSREVVSSTRAGPVAGPYSQAVKAGGFVFCSGVLPLDPATGQLRASSIEEATEQCLANLRAILEAAGSSLADAVQVSVYMTDLSLFPRMNAVYARFFPAEPPARVTIGASALPRGSPIEIALTAVCRDGAQPGARA